MQYIEESVMFFGRLLDQQLTWKENKIAKNVNIL